MKQKIATMSTFAEGKHRNAFKPVALLICITVLLTAFSGITVSAASYSRIELPVPYFCQRIYADCAISSIAMVEAYYHGYPSNSDTIYNIVYGSNGSVNIWSWDALGYSVVSSDLTTVYNYLKAGHPVIVGRANNAGLTHYSVIYAYNGNTSQLETSGFYVLNTYRIDGVVFGIERGYTVLNFQQWLNENSSYWTQTVVRTREVIIIPPIHTHTYTSSVTKQPTCTEEGVRTFTCTSCSNGSYTEKIPALQHSWNSGEIVENAGCVADGLKKFTCTRCGETKYEAISANGHTSVTDPAVAPTCNSVGYTEGSHCSKCNAIITGQTVIPALGHDYSLNNVVYGCCDVTGSYTCTRCGNEKTETSSDYIWSDWRTDRIEEIDSSLEDTKTQYSCVEQVVSYGEWKDAGWVRTKPTESDTLKITSTKNVTDSAAYTIYHYYHYYGYSGGQIWNSYGSVYPNLETTQSTAPFPAGKLYDGYYQSYTQSISGMHGNLWWISSTENVPATTHTEWFYQTRTKDVAYNNYDWQDTPIEVAEGTQVNTRTLYRYKITPKGHTFSDEWCYDELKHWHECVDCDVTSTSIEHIYDNSDDATCNVCGYARFIEPIVVDPSDPQIVIDTKSARCGENITLSITLKNTDALKSIALSGITYDSNALELIGGSWMFENSALSNVDITKKVAAIAFSNNTDCNGIIFSLIFKVKENVDDGVYPVSCAISAKYMEANSEKTVNVASVAGAVNVVSVLKGDVNSDNEVNSDDAIYLLYNTLLPDMYPINQNGDFDGNGELNSDDAIYLLYYTLLPSLYPLQ